MFQLSELLKYVRDHNRVALHKLNRLLRIPSISSLPSHRDDMKDAAKFIADELKDIGLEKVRVVEGKPGEHPLVRADWCKRPGSKTVLLYAHYDVQPVDPISDWTSHPFDPTIRGNKLFARGSADDKGQIFIILSALRAFMGTYEKLPVNIKILFEGEEESTGSHVDRFVREQAAELADVDSVVVLDNGMFAPGMPTITTGLRGIVCAEVTVHGGKSDEHSGKAGGAAPNATHALSQMIARLMTPVGNARIPGFYKDVIRPSKQERDCWATLPFDQEEYRQSLGAPALVGDPRYSVLERLWGRPTLEVNGISGGFAGGDGFKTVIPCKAAANISMRLVPGMNPDAIAKSFTDFIKAITPRYVTSEVKVLSTAPAISLDLASPAIRLAADAYKETFGAETVFVRSGGSIPIASTFQEVLGKPILISGFTLPDCNMHAPNENLDLDNFRLGTEAMVRYFLKLGGL